MHFVAPGGADKGQIRGITGTTDKLGIRSHLRMRLQYCVNVNFLILVIIL